MSRPVFTDGLGYEGKVTLTLKSNNRVLKSKVYKNSGRAPLFKFLGHCLVDDYISAKALLPNKILLLYNKASEPSSNIVTEVEARSSWRQLAQQPTMLSDNADDQVKVVYSFEIPKQAITGEFNQVALYGANTNDITNFSAYYFLADDSGKFDNQSTANWSSSTILLIEWELTISNKNEVAKNENQQEEI